MLARASWIYTEKTEAARVEDRHEHINLSWMDVRPVLASDNILLPAAPKAIVVRASTSVGPTAPGVAIGYALRAQGLPKWAGLVL